MGSTPIERPDEELATFQMPEQEKEEIIITEHLRAALYWKQRKEYKLAAKYFDYIQEMAQIFENECNELDKINNP